MAESSPSRVFLTIPSGNVGGRVATTLTSRQVPLSVLGRDGHLDEIDPAVQASADVHVGELVDAAALTSASRGASAMFVVYPVDPVSDDLPEMWRALTRAAVAAVEANNISHVVLLSSQGSDTGGGAMLDSLYEAEQDFATVVPNLRVLRPGFFMENLLPDVELIAEGTLPICTLPATKIRLVATADVADVAIDLLADLFWEGHDLFQIYGPDELNGEEIASIVSGAIDRPVEYEYVAPEKFLSILLEFGFTPGTAAPMVDLFTSMGDPQTSPSSRDKDLITKTSLDAFARIAIAPRIQALTA